MQILLPRPERNGWLNGAVRSHFVSRKPSQAEKYLHVSCLSAKMRDAQYSSKWQHSSHPDLQGAARIIRILPAICRTIPSSPDLHLIVKRAAEIQGLTMTDFVIHALQIAASQTIERADRVRFFQGQEPRSRIISRCPQASGHGRDRSICASRCCQRRVCRWVLRSPRVHRAPRTTTFSLSAPCNSQIFA